MSAYDRLFFFKNSNCTIDFHIDQVPKLELSVRKVWQRVYDFYSDFELCLLVVEVFESHWYFIFTFLVKNYFECASVVINFKQSPHWLLLLCNNATHNYNLNFLLVLGGTYIVDCFSLNFTHIIRAGRCFLNHLHSNWSENAVFSALATKHLILATHVLLHIVVVVTVIVHTHIWGHKKALIARRGKLFYT